MTAIEIVKKMAEERKERMDALKEKMNSLNIPEWEKMKKDKE